MLVLSLVNMIIRLLTARFTGRNGSFAWYFALLLSCYFTPYLLCCRKISAFMNT